jgi:hypothetical protein
VTSTATYEGLIVQRYRLTRQLGAGGFGVVYEAVHVELGRLAAVKILDPGYARHPEMVGRFHREARLAAAVKHDVIIDILDVGTLATGEPYIVMEHVSGRSLAEELEADGPLALARVRSVFEPLYAAVAAVPAIRDAVTDILFTALQDTAARWNDLAALLEMLMPVEDAEHGTEIVRLVTPVFLCLAASISPFASVHFIACVEPHPTTPPIHVPGPKTSTAEC